MEDIKNTDKFDIETKIHLYGKSMELGKILGLNDTIALLNLLNESPKRYKDIAPNISLSQPSLSRRLLMLQNLNIIKKEPIRSKSRKTHVYNLTIRGEKLMRFINSYEKEITLPSEQQKIIEVEDNK